MNRNKPQYIRVKCKELFLVNYTPLILKWLVLLHIVKNTLLNQLFQVCKG